MKPIFLSFFIVITCLTFLSLPQAAEENIQLDELLDNIEQGFLAQDSADWQAIVLTSMTELDKKENPVKVTNIKRRMVVNGQKTESEILEAVFIEKGERTDITQKTIDQSKKSRDENKNQGTGISWEKVFPFNKKDREKYAIQRLDDSVLNGKAVFVIETRVKEKDVNNYEGHFYFDKDLYKIVKMSIKPSETPMFVKELSLEVDFKLLKGNTAAIEKLKSEVKGSFLFKQYHILIEEEYTEHEFI